MAEPLILTTIGLAKLASATPEDQLHIADVAVGDGNGGYPPLDPSMTALVHEVWRGTASAPIRDPDNDAVLIFETIIPPEDGGFFIREVGLFDADGDLIAIGQTGLVEKPGGGSGTPMTMTVRVRLALANASQTNLIINDAPYIDHQALTNRNASNAHPISSIAGLQGALDGKLAIVQNLADLDDVATARSNLGLGTAAVANVTTSSTDTTAGRVLRVGDFGLGTISPPLVTDLNDALANGIYRFLETAANIPPPPMTGADGALFVFGQVPTNPNSLFGHLTQIAVMRATGDFWVRSADGMDSNGDIEWGEWKNLWFNVATAAQAQALTDDTTIITPLKLLESGAVFPGEIRAFAGPVGNIPAGWLPCHGSTVSRTTYARLFAAIGTTYGDGDGSTTFKLPDLRGEFLRGLDNARGVDAGRTLGEHQDDAMQNVTGTFQSVVFSGTTGTVTGPFSLFGTTNGIYGGGSSGNTRGVSFDLSAAARTADETRPRNMPVNFIIKY